MLDHSESHRMSDAAFAALGGPRLAYVRAVRSEEIMFLTPDAPTLAPGHCVFVLHGADGEPLLLAGSREAALADAARREIETVWVH
ncbi:MAG: DUF1150 domain-containing protein [Hyphomicrobiales bacterium]|nr:DUF1150 domain-containing protein [Hyphomicrobiales bacterium]